MLIDLRAKDAFQKGSFVEALSYPAHNETQLGEQVILLRKEYPDKALHLFDHGNLLDFSTITDPDIRILKGGYKAFRQWRKEAFHDDLPLIVLGGKAGAMKTERLHQLREAGEQVIDLEGLANHKGSVFGNLEQLQQPNNDVFQNSLLKQWLSFDKNQPIWIEEEGPFLGKNSVPEHLYKAMLIAPTFELEVSFDERHDHIVHEYETSDRQAFQSAIKLLEKRMGTSRNHKAIHQLNKGNMVECIRLLLEYYDRSYMIRRRKFRKGEVTKIETTLDDEELISELITLGKALV